MVLQWRIIDDDALEFRCWDEEEVVVYNALSGDTHLLDALAADILLTLRHEAQDMLSLAQLLARKWQCESTPEFLEELEMMLSDMHALSLIERA
jgi:PqqD family protein of HPr-rel-A system